MGVGQAIGAASLVICATVVLVLIGALRASRRDKPVERVWHVWNRDGRHATTGDTRPDHDPDDEDCWCRPCYDAELVKLQDVEVFNLFAGLVDTPELRDLADRAERGLR